VNAPLLARVAAGAAALALFAASAAAGTREYELVVEERNVVIAGEPRRALSVNGGVPGPTLRFEEGDEAVVRVVNRLATETSVHWHGLLVPNDQDGVPHVTTPPIPPGETHVFRFPLRQSGTYWYHSHTGLQEQRGVYGSLVVAPRGGEPARADGEQVVVLSDWTDEDPSEVMRTLMRGSEWYSLRKGALPSLLGAWRADRLGDYLRAQWQRMPPMDVSDVAYDAFLVNGARRIDVPAMPGEVVRLRFVNASSSTYFQIESAAGPMTIVAADGPAVEPVATEGFLMAIAETYDVLVRVPGPGSFEVRATSQDGTGYASVFVGSGEERRARDIPRLDIYSMDHMLEGAMESHGHAARKPAGGRPGSPYRVLRALAPSRADPAAPRRDLEMRLTGDMTRYQWSFDGKTMAEESVVRVRRGEVLRIALANDTMMHHPIHLHGHFFRVLDGDDADAPLKHTVDVPPMGRRVIEFDAVEPGDWLFHCHVLYHMEAGMTRVFTYGGPEHEPVMDPGMMGMTHVVGEATALTRMASGRIIAMSGRRDYGVSFDAGWRPGHRTEYEGDAYAEHFFDENVSVAAGYRVVREERAPDRAFAAVSYRLPLLARARLEADSRGGGRVGLSKEFQVTDRLELSLHGQYDTWTHFEGRVGLEYVLTKSLSLAAEAHTDHGVGVGIAVRF
jgi:FtsP/CotA-like multicopper oxidase with cupredoxin domain